MRQPKVREAILDYLATNERGYGLEMMRAIGCRSGSLYPALGWLEDQGFIVGQWEDHDRAERGPRRRYYTLAEAQ